MPHRSPGLRLLAGASLLLAGGCGMSERFVSIGSCDANHSAAGLSRLEVYDRAGSVVVTPSSDDAVAVSAAVSVRESRREEFPAADAARDLKVTVDGGTLRIADAHGDEHFGCNFQVDLTIRAPARLAWKVELGAGSVEVTGGGNAIDVETGAGGVKVAGAVAALRASSGAGSVVADVETIVGGTLHSGAGSVRLVVARGGITEALSCTSGAGGVTISVPPELSANVVLDTGAGHLSVDGATLESMSEFVGGSARGRLGKGGPQLLATSGAGGVTLTVRH